MGRGGRRPGAGRKPKNLAQLAAVVRMPANQTPPSTVPVPEVEEFDAPDSLMADERAIWLRQSPFACANGTLTKASAVSFERYCQVAALERRIARSDEVGKADHRGLLKQINAYELQFLLTPCGKPLPQEMPAPVEQPESKLARFRKLSS